MKLPIRNTEIMLTPHIIRAVQRHLISGRLDVLVGDFRVRDWLDAFASYIAKEVAIEEKIDKLEIDWNRSTHIEKAQRV